MEYMKVISASEALKNPLPPVYPPAVPIAGQIQELQWKSDAAFLFLVVLGIGIVVCCVKVINSEIKSSQVMTARRG